MRSLDSAQHYLENIADGQYNKAASGESNMRVRVMSILATENFRASYIQRSN